VPDRFLLLNDLPVESQEADLLGTAQIAVDLAELVHGSRDNTPFVLAIDGPWGAGKSSHMRQLSRALQEREVEIVWFNAWTASGASALTAMLKLVLAKLDRSLVRRAFRRLDGGGYLGRALRIAVTMVAGFFRVDRAIDELWERMSVDVKARQEARDLLQAAMTSWVDEGRGGPRRTIVVFVDDLDRCADTTAIEICEAIKLYLDLPGLVFVLGCDLNVLARMPVQGAYMEGSLRVRQYLEKIVQVSYQIATPAEGAVRAMIRGYADRSRTGDLLTDAVVRLIASQSGGNPRRIKRLFNSFVAEYQLDAGWRDFGAEGLIKAVILQHYYPEFYLEIVHGSADVVGELLDYRRARDWLLGAEASPDLEVILRRHGVPMPGALEPDTTRRSLLELDERVPRAWRQHVDSEDFLTLLREVGDVDERRRLQERLRRRPLSTSPATDDMEAARHSRLDGLRLLWVDDEPVGNESMINNLMARGAQIRTVTDREQALMVLPFFAPNVLISDVSRYGEEVGFDDLKAIRESGYTGPAFFFVGQMTDDRRAGAAAAGADGIDNSVSAVMAWLESRHTHLSAHPRATMWTE
jgi:CheY-like chemotaxis protein